MTVNININLQMNGKYTFWNFRGGVSLSAQNFALVLGYGVSKLDIYSSRRLLSIENISFSEFYPNNPQFIYQLYPFFLIFLSTSFPEK